MIKRVITGFTVGTLFIAAAALAEEPTAKQKAVPQATPGELDLKLREALVKGASMDETRS